MKDLELYIHIPFCAQKCRYCDFLSAPADDGARASYVKRLIEEIGYSGSSLYDRKVKTIFIGGGTPSILSAEEISSIMQCVYKSFAVDPYAEMTIECNPGTVDREKAYTYRECGINRISLGLQSTDNESLRLLGRIHTYEQFLESYDILRNAGFENINIDLMSAMPGQSPGDWERTLRETAQLGPEHISAYSLIIEKGTPFYDIYGAKEHESLEKKECVLRSDNGSVYPPLPDEEADRLMYSLTKEILEEYGYHRYEISNYAKSGYECRHNIGYWRRADYLGLGLGASSMIDNVRFKNTDDMCRYMNGAHKKDIDAASNDDEGPRGSSPVPGPLKKLFKADPEQECAYEDIETLDTSSQIEEFMFLGLRMSDGVTFKDFEDSFGISIDSIYGDVIKKMSALEMIDVSEGGIKLTDRGIDVSNTVLAEFIL